jgi:hypothetical protein
VPRRAKSKYRYARVSHVRARAGAPSNQTATATASREEICPGMVVCLKDRPLSPAMFVQWISREEGGSIALCNWRTDEGVEHFSEYPVDWLVSF